MKLRYYLRGLGVGLLVATLVLAISNADKRPLTDAEIRMRAAELGMVDGDSVKLPAADKTPAEDVPAVQDAVPEGNETQESGDAQDAEPSENDAQETQREEEPDVQDNAAEPVTIVIRGGMGSYSVSQALEEAGLVSDAGAYDAFLCNNGYSGKIRAGTYEITPGTSEEDIAKMIAD